MEFNGSGTPGSGEGDLDMPWGITVDNQGDVYVADWNHHRAQKFSPDGAHLLTSGLGELRGVSPDGGMAYSHAFLANVEVSPRNLNHPTGMAVDGDGDVYVVDWMNEQAEICGSKADPVATLRGDASGLSKWAEFSIAANSDMGKVRRRVKDPDIQKYLRMPVGGTFDQHTSRLTVCDTHRGRVQIYHKDDAYMDLQFNL